MSYITIRRNAVKKIREILADAKAIAGSHYCEMEGTTYFTKTAEEILADLPNIQKVYGRLDDAGKLVEVTFSFWRGASVSAWLDVDFAHAHLYLSSFARTFPTDPRAVAYREEEAAKAAAAEKARRDAEAAEQARLEALPEPAEYTVGSRLVARFASLNKRCTAEEYRAECVKPEGREGRNESTNWSDDLCVVEKVLELAPAEFAHLCGNLLEDRSDLGNGGTGSDAEIDLAGREFWQLSEAERAEYVAKSWRSVTVVLCAGCRPLVIDAQGYKYARYVGLWPRPVPAPAAAEPVMAQVIPFPASGALH